MSSALYQSFPFKLAAVTGATGFLGSHLVNSLVKRGVRVRALTKSNSIQPHNADADIETIRGDIRDRDTVWSFVKGVDVVFHTAALVTPWVKQPSAQYAINFQATEWIIEAAKSFDIPVIWTGSIVVLNPFPLPPSARFLDGNHYVRSKRMAFDLIKRAREEGVKASSILPSGIVGPADLRPTKIGQLIREVMNGKAPLLCFKGGLHLIDVRDVAEAHILAAIKGPGDYALPGEYWPIDRLYNFIGQVSGKQRRTLFLPTPLVIIGSLALIAWSEIKTLEAPVITPAWIHYFREAESMGYPDDSHKLDLHPRAISHALEDEVSWFAGRSNND